MPSTLANGHVLMTSAEYFSTKQAINAYMGGHRPVNQAKAIAEHERIQAALKSAGIEVLKINPPIDCQDGVYTANWALIRDNKAVLSRLPNARKAEEPYAKKHLEALGIQTIAVPEDWHFSGQGDVLPCGNFLLAGYGYRTDKRTHRFLAETLGYEVISLRTRPKRSLWGLGRPVINTASGWPDSFFYDIDLALAVIKPHTSNQTGLIAWCPKAFTPVSAARIQALPMDKIEVSLYEAKHAFACNLISTGQTVVMSASAPKLKKSLEEHNLSVITPEVTELGKGGGYIRCTALTLDN